MQAEEAGHEAAAGFDFQELMVDPAFWAAVGLLIFLGVIVYMKVHQQVLGSLDKRAEKIAADIKNAEELRLLAEAKLEAARKRQVEAEAEAKEIIDAARREAAELAADASRNLAETIARRQKLAEDRIGRAEADAMREVRLAAVDAASRATETLLADQLAGKGGAAQYAASLETVKKALA
jgi:F-type H+-transporting ATPase subunit b